MIKEKKFLLFVKIFSSVLVILISVFPFIFRALDKVEIIYDSGSVDYSSFLDSSTCEVEILVNKKLWDSSLTVEFYDESGIYIGTYTEDYLLGYGNVYTADFYSVPGNVSYYTIVAFYANSYAGTIIFMLMPYLIFLSLIIFIPPLTLSCKTYRYDDIKIIVYAGFSRHYIKVNDKKVDEHNTLISFTPIILSSTLEKGQKLEATISLTNRISLKVDDVLYLPEKN